MLAILVERHHLHRDVARLGILLQLAEDGPAEHVGQEDVERHRGRPVLARQRQRVGAARRGQHLEAVVVGEVDEHSRVVRVVLDDEQRRLAGLHVLAVVGHRLDGPLRPADRQPEAWSPGVVGGAGSRSASPVGPT